MATEAARLKRKEPTGRKKRKTDLTLTGLLMEGLGRTEHYDFNRLFKLIR